MATKSGSATFLAALKARRTYYALKPSSPISNEKIQEIVNEVVLHTPSSFNSQTTRAVILFGDEHKKLWSIITHDALKAVVPADAFAATAQKVAGFANGYGTVMFFEDQVGVKKLQDAFPLYAPNFPVWSEHTAGAHHINTWTALEAEGLGANLQHYNPLIDDAVRKEWNIPETWALRAQLVFGERAGEPGPKTFVPIEERVKTYGN
ncbi:Nitroreductase [Ascodesmis nigricans]|uniref:Nitroreductase n=1 Tax=Ascodesmis nigricans TaxID=341454 RepID=A0A4S2MZE1_9PEZI|nr:Nitroreductase [Ascodesmis nigricans]